MLKNERQCVGLSEKKNLLEYIARWEREKELSPVLKNNGLGNKLKERRHGQVLALVFGR